MDITTNIQQENEQLIAELHHLQEEHAHLLDLIDQYAFKLTEANCEMMATKARVYHKPGIFRQLTDYLGLTKHRLHYDIMMSGHFDETWYLQTYPDVAKSGISPIKHYLKFGAKEGRNPGPYFHSHWYLRTYPDVLAKDINPLVHYINHGKKEGRHTQQNPRLFSNPTDVRIRWLMDGLNEQKNINGKLDEQLVQLRHELFQTHDERRRVSAQFEAQITETQTQLSIMHKQLESLNDERRSTTSKLSKEVSVLKRQLDEAQIEHHNTVKEYELQIGELRQQLEDALRAIQSYESHTAKVDAAGQANQQFLYHQLQSLKNALTDK